MSETEPLSLSSSFYGSSAFKKVIVQKQQAEDKVKSSYARLINFLHAREFMAELLATFILVVRFYLPTGPLPFLPLQQCSLLPSYIHCCRNLVIDPIRIARNRQ